MRTCFASLLLAVVTVFAFSPGLLAQTSAGPARPDLSGIWDSDAGNARLTGAGALAGGAPDSFGGVPAPRFTREEPQMTPEALRIYRARREGRDNTQRGREEADPRFWPYCVPSSFPSLFGFYPMIEVVQTPNVLYMLFENDHQVRRIFLDGRRHLEGWHPTLMGTSHGRWDGDTLVVETENILALNNEGWLDPFGHPFTEALRVTERIRRTARDTLQIDFMFTDPGAYTAPWPGKKVFQLSTTADLVDSSFCEQPSQENYLRDIRAGKPGGKP